ncbi:MAG: RNA methyltransferase [Weeksellaceae bacterium]|nr:RNA methyltransferase [Weeksellaceae bacterium]
MPSKSQTQLIRSLSQKKYRLQHRLFVVEGEKSVLEFLASDLRLHAIYTTESHSLPANIEAEKVSQQQMQTMSQLKTPPGLLAVFHIPTPDTDLPTKGVHLVLDQVSDPGNLGTIIRLADWYGIQSIYCSSDTVDAYNPKSVQASMGSLARVQPTYTDLIEMLQTTSLPVFGAFLHGTSIYAQDFPEDMLLIVGSESHGISSKVLQYCSQNITIPRAATSQAESLNVTVATAAIVSHIFAKRLG